MNSNRIALSAILLATSSLVPFSAAWAQEADTASTQAQTDDVIVVRYRFVPDDKRVTSEVSSFLSADDFITTGDGNIADALARVPGVSISQGRFPVVRGLNERYSNTLINGSPLASPEPLLRAAPLDLLPTSIINNVLVQKTFSPQYTGEFGGGLVEVETSALPAERFFEIGVSGSADTESSFTDGLLHDGGANDSTGFDDGTRAIDSEFQELFATQRILGLDPNLTAELGRSLENSSLWVVQEGDLPGNAGLDLSAGDRFDFDNFSIGVMASASYDNVWKNRIGSRSQTTARTVGGELVAETPVELERFSTINDIALNGLLGAGVEFGDHEIQALAMVLRSTEKETRVQIGNLIPTEDFDGRRDNTEWFERQVYTYQISGDHAFESLGGLEADWRWSFSDASRNAPNQREVNYFPENLNDSLDCTLFSGSPAGGTNCVIGRNGRISTGNRIRFSRVDEEVNDYGVDFNLPLTLFDRSVELKAGYSYFDRERSSFSRNFAFDGPTTGADVRGNRVDFVFSDPLIGPLGSGGLWTFRESGASGAADAFDGKLEVEAAYVQADFEVTPFLRAAAGLRYEEGEQSTSTFNFDAPALQSTVVSAEDYLLPAATLTWTFAENMQVRFGYSETIARPQFRELGFATFIDTELDQRFRGNPFLEDTELTNYDARYEWYFGRDQFFTVGVFYKQLENPILETIFDASEEPTNTFLNAPEADVMGFELEFEKTFDFSDRFSGDFWEDAEFFVNTNYTYSQSEISVGEGDTTTLAGVGSTADNPVVANVEDADDRIKDGGRLQGQADHIANLQIGWKNVETGSRTAVLVNYTGERLRSVQFDNTVDANGDALAFFPEVIEQLPVQVDLVHSRTITVGSAGDFSARFAVRNLLGQDYEARQEVAGEEFVFDQYDVGTTFSVSLTRRF